MNTGGKIMDFSSQLDVLEQQAAGARAGVQAAATENRDQLRKRIEQAQVDSNRDQNRAQPVAKAPAGTHSKWDQMKADAAHKMDDVKARIDKRTQKIDADMAMTEADMAEADATAAIDYAAWSIDNARLATLDAIDARAYANMQTGTKAS